MTLVFIADAFASLAALMRLCCAADISLRRCCICLIFDADADAAATPLISRCADCHFLLS